MSSISSEMDWIEVLILALLLAPMAIVHTYHWTEQTGAAQWSKKESASRKEQIECEP